MEAINFERDRQPTAPRGATFWEKENADGSKTLMFEFRCDASSVFGPVKATQDHVNEHPAAYAAFQALKKGEAVPEEPKAPVVSVIERQNVVSGEPVKRGPGRPRKDANR